MASAPLHTHLQPCADYSSETVRAALLAAIEAVGGLDWVQPGMRIGIKLNLCAARRPEAAATTHPVLAAELTRLLVERGAAVVLGDSPGEPFSAAVLNRTYSATGVRLCEEAGGILNQKFGYSTVSFPAGVTVKEFPVCDWLRECDAVISFSKLKSHGLMGMTAAVKNLYGIVPGTAKFEFHYRYPDPASFCNLLVDLNEYLKPRLCLCDAVEIMEGNGPTQGIPRHLGVLLAGTDPYEMDRLCAALVGVGEEEIPYLSAAKQRGLISERDGGRAAVMAAPYRLDSFQRSGATGSWFLADPADTPIRKLMKRALTLLFRSRPALGEGCTGCGHCVRLCPAGAIRLQNKRAVIDRRKCVRCFCCQEFCPSGAMQVQRTVIARLLTK